MQPLLCPCATRSVEFGTTETQSHSRRPSDNLSDSSSESKRHISHISLQDAAVLSRFDLQATFERNSSVCDAPSPTDSILADSRCGRHVQTSGCGSYQSSTFRRGLTSSGIPSRPRPSSRSASSRAAASLVCGDNSHARSRLRCASRDRPSCALDCTAATNVGHSGDTRRCAG